MRPHRLEMEGFGTFRERVEIDFNGLDLVALVGPTGSGKSTVIDAITFALYGSVARYDNTSLVAPVIHQLSAEARVRFDFELAGLTYSAVRVVRRTKAAAGGGPRATTREARLERTETDGTSTVLAGNVSELDGEVGELIGLDFHQFTRTIVLPQGEFAEFLTDDPGNRQKLLRRLLDLDIYARMGGRARDAAREAGQRIELLTEERERLARFTPELRAQTEARRDAVAAFAATPSGVPFDSAGCHRHLEMALEADATKSPGQDRGLISLGRPFRSIATENLQSTPSGWGVVTTSGRFGGTRTTGRATR